MAIISVTDAAQIKKTLEENLVDDVRVVLFVEPLPKLFVPGRPAGAGLNRETQQLLEELAALSDKIKLEVHDATEEPQAAQSYGVDSFPAIVIEKNGHKNVRFYGFPGGYEFATLLEAFVKVSSHTSPLSQETKDELKKIDEQLLIQVFVTPTWPYCPVAASLAQSMALENPAIEARVIEATEFPALVQRYGVRGVPATVISDVVMFVGALPEKHFLAQVKGAAQKLKAQREGTQPPSS